MAGTDVQDSPLCPAALGGEGRGEHMAHMISQPSAIARRYLQTYLFLDVVAAIPCDDPRHGTRRSLASLDQTLWSSPTLSLPD